MVRQSLGLRTRSPFFRQRRIQALPRPGASGAESPQGLRRRLTLIAYRYTIKPVIRSFRDGETEKIFNGTRSRKSQAIQAVAIRKLFQIHSAKSLHDLRSPGNSLEALTADRAGQHSVRINERYRVCFTWENGDAYHVEVTDYH